jgi:nitrogen fixation NifU-like protein
LDDGKNDIELDALYRDTVLDHFRSPRGQKALDRIDLKRDGYNEDVAVNCKGCVISVASASMLAELLPGKSREEVLRLAEAFKQMMHGHPPPPGLDIGDLDALEGVKNFPVRVKCALLAWMTLIEALQDTEESGRPEDKGTTTE